MPKTDVENDDLEGQDPSTSSTETSEGSMTLAEALKRIRGKDQYITKLKKQNQGLQSQLDEGSATTEEELANWKSRASKAEKELAQKAKDYGVLEEAKNALANENAKLLKKSEDGALIADKFKELLPDHLIGDLKSSSDFADTAAYEAYLGRQAKKAAVTPALDTEVDTEAEEGDELEVTPSPPAQRSLEQRTRGMTPSAAVRVVDARKGKRSANQIALDMDSVEPGTPKWGELMKELNEATS